MPRDNRYEYMAHACFYVSCSDYVMDVVFSVCIVRRGAVCARA